jgi:hypothetical protein
MKCIKLINSTKNTEVGTIVRVSDIEADTRVSTGSWKFVSKSEYKSFLKPEVSDVEKADKPEKKKKSK